MGSGVKRQNEPADDELSMHDESVVKPYNTEMDELPVDNRHEVDDSITSGAKAAIKQTLNDTMRRAYQKVQSGI